MGHGEESPMPNAQCPKSTGGCSSPPTRGWSFPPTSNEAMPTLGEATPTLLIELY
ncbi:hypothetical protein [Nostoc sp. CHAB 5715]|uniref:hypothetical protein n=1 Tax=Nostoc sp. CHAB 5715 TaxID=2780400 RepID=UPI001E62BF2A|nr:hypothetical protein [Nostoc sp. CHAB 5715]MCC5623177.1 hypothetical protein [Nostoc sp. CHAB 5715]